MANKYWLGTADAVAQVATGSIDTVDGTPANNTFTVTIGGVAISAVGDTDVATTATNLRASLNASTHPYFEAITWSGATGDIIGTADTAGAPFIAALTETGAGTGSVTDFAATTASAGPNDWSTADNWSDGAVPGAADNVTISESSVSIAWGLDQNAVDLTSLTVLDSFTGKIGLDRTQFATAADAATFSTVAKAEYREDYLIIGSDLGNLGQNLGPSSGAGSGRIKWKNDKAGAADIIVHKTSTASTETGLPAIRLLAANANIDLWIRDAQAGVGVAMDEPDETSTFGTISISAENSTTRVFVSDGVTYTTYTQSGGDNIISSAGTPTTVEVNGGKLVLEADFAVTTMEVNAGEVIANNVKTSAVEFATINQNGGIVDFSKSNRPRVVTTYNLDEGTLISDDAVLTITTLDQPAGLTTLTAS